MCSSDLVDTFPAGSFDELFQLLDGPFRKAFIFREVKPEYGNRPIFQAALGLYDTVVAPHRAPPPAGDPPPGRAASGRPVHYCGEVLQLEREEARPAAEVRQELGLAPGAKLVFLSAGGGGDPGAEEALTSLVEALRDDPGLHLLTFLVREVGVEQKVPREASAVIGVPSLDGARARAAVDALEIGIDGFTNDP